MHFVAMLAGLRAALLLYRGEDGWEELDINVHISKTAIVKPYIFAICKRLYLTPQPFFARWSKDRSMVLVYPSSSSNLVQRFEPNPFTDEALQVLLSFPCPLPSLRIKRYAFDLYFKETSLITYLCSNKQDGETFGKTFVREMRKIYQRVALYQDDEFFVSVRVLN